MFKVSTYNESGTFLYCYKGFVTREEAQAWLDTWAEYDYYHRLHSVIEAD